MATGTQELAPGGGGGADRPLRPTENYDDEEPGNRRSRVIEAIQQMHQQRYGEKHGAYIGFSPDSVQDLLHKQNTGFIALRGGGIGRADQSPQQHN
jgi:hypothetical protein